jgi:hypothetical protein
MYCKVCTAFLGHATELMCCPAPFLFSCGTGCSWTSPCTHFSTVRFCRLLQEPMRCSLQQDVPPHDHIRKKKTLHTTVALSDRYRRALADSAIGPSAGDRRCALGYLLAGRQVEL